MAVAVNNTAVLGLLSELFTYPDAGLRAKTADVRQSLQSLQPGAAADVAAFEKILAEWPFERVEEAYTRAFDVAPHAVPYLSVYLFGEESFKRAELMTGLLESYERIGLDTGGELPDHFALVLRAAPRLGAEEWAEMMHWVLPGPIRAMAQGLEKAGNPYVYLMHAVQRVLQDGHAQETYHV